jgi:hypothetical protein
MYKLGDPLMGREYYSLCPVLPKLCYDVILDWPVIDNRQGIGDSVILANIG